MAGVIHRAAIALGFPLCYSQGFQPHPRISFGPPLPFGAIGNTEAFDMVTSEPLQGDPLILNTMLPPELRVLSYRIIDEHAPSLSASIAAVEYRIEAVASSPNAEAMRRAVENAQNASSLPVKVIRNGIATIKELRPLIFDLTYAPGLRPDERPGIQALLLLEPGKTCKPSELLEMLFPRSLFSDFSVARTACMIRERGELSGL